MSRRSTLRRVAACGVATALLGASLAQATEPLKLLVWINPDKGYNGLQKVGDHYAADTGVQVVVPSMLRLDHVRANVTAIKRSRFSSEEIQWLRVAITATNRC